MGWTVDVRKHVIRTVVTEVLEGDVWWGRVPDDDEPGDEGGEREARGRSKKGGGEGPKREGKGNVPKPVIEVDCVVSAYKQLSIYLSQC